MTKASGKAVEVGASAPPDKTEKQPIKRAGKNGGIRPGAGRKPGVPNKNKKAVKDLIEPHIEKLVQGLLMISANAETDSARIAATKELFERCLGKVPQAVVGGDGGPVVVEIVKFAGDSK